VSDKIKHQQPNKDPLRNFVRIISSGQFLEIPKIIRRRTLNSVKFLRRAFWAVFCIAYDHPAVKLRREQRRLRHILSECYNYSLKGPADGKLKIALVLRDGTHYPKSSAFIRLISPLTDDSIKEKVAITLFAENTVLIPAGFNACIVQRTAYDDEATAKQLLEDLRLKQIPLIVDNDDGFTIIDPTHPEHNEHKDRVDALNLLVKEADQIWVSVPKLKKHQPANKNTVVVRNTLDPRLWQHDNDSPRAASKGPLRLLYMGTVSHDADLEMIMPALEALVKKYPGSFELTVIGVASDLPEHDWIKRVYQKSGSSIYPKFVRWFLKQGPYDIGLSPLVDSEFNRCKSDIKCLDYFGAGILPVVSDIEPYRNKELDDYTVRIKNTTAEWESQLGKFLDDPETFREERDKKISKARKYLWEERSSEDAAEQLLAMLNKLRT